MKDAPTSGALDETSSHMSWLIQKCQVGCGPDSQDRIISSVSSSISTNKTGDPTDLPDAASRISKTSGQHSSCSQLVEHVRQRRYLLRLAAGDDFRQPLLKGLIDLLLEI